MAKSSSKVVLTFDTETGTTTNIIVNNAKENITLSEIESIAADIVAENVFYSKAGDLASFKYAERITTTTELIE